MTHKEIKFDQDGREALERGVDKLARAVRVTLGPRGRYAVLHTHYGSPTVTNDGVTIAREMELENLFENQGAQLVKEVAIRTNDAAGDGTTTATVLTQIIAREGLKNVAAGARPVFLRSGLEKAAESASRAILAQSKDLSGRDEVALVGAISARSEEIGNVISEAIERVGKDGVVNVEEGQSVGLALEFTEGMHFDKGYISHQFVTDEEQSAAILDDPCILLANQKIGNVQDVLDLLNQVMQQSRPLLVVAEDVEGEALSTLIVNKLRGSLEVAAIRAPSFGARRERMMEDIAILTGGEVITEELGLKLENTQMNQLGRARRVVVTKDGTTIVDGAGEAEAIRSRIEQIRRELRVASSEFDREKLQERLAKLSGGVAVIKVGAATETELKEKKHRVEDALSATRAALEEGVVPGGGVALLHAQEAVGELMDSLDGDELTGARIIHRALEEPIRQISSNAGADGSIVVDKVRNQGGNTGYNALSGEYEDLVEAGIIEPALVTRSALQNAVSIGGLIVTTEAVVAEPSTESGAAGVTRAGMNMDMI